MEADHVIDVLRLAPHPEGGYYRQTHADAASTAIYYLLRDGEASRWHRVMGRAEVWHFYAGSPLELLIDEDGGGDRVDFVRLGRDLDDGQRPQAIVPPGAWQRARSTGGWSLAGCTVAPPFTFDAFELR